MNTATMNTEVPPPRMNLFGGAALGAVVVIAISLVGHKVVYGTFLQPKQAAVVAADEGPTQAAPVPFVARANVPNAIISYRGESLPLPADTQVPASAMNDYVEVTAPGYEGRRFWLKFDRPRSLIVTLPAGSGIIDATYDETEVALGQAPPKPTKTEHAIEKTKPQGGGIAAAPTRGGGGAGSRRGQSAPRETPPQPAASAAAPPPAVTQAPPPAEPTGRVRPKLDNDPWATPPK